VEKVMSYIAFFDLDRTIINLNSGSIMVRHAYKNGLLSTKDLFSAIFQSFLYELNLRDTNRIISSMGCWLKGLSVSFVNEISNDIVKLYLIKAIRPEIYREINFHKEKNAEVVLLSSAISPICIPIGLHLGINNVLCTDLEAVNGILTGKPSGQFCYKEEKRIRLIKYCENKNYALSMAYYYGDSISDLPALEVVGYPVCVHPDRKLAGIARQRGWEIYDW
jgi:HAD superfamily hydrolase (TIGR01490 family)